MSFFIIFSPHHVNEVEWESVWGGRLPGGQGLPTPVLKGGQPVKKFDQAFYHGSFTAVGSHIQTWLCSLSVYVVFLLSTKAAKSDYFPHPISSCFLRVYIRDSSPLLSELLVSQLPNWFNENELGYLKRVKHFATQADFNWNWIRAYSHKQLRWSIWQDSNQWEGQGVMGLVGGVGTAADGRGYVIQLDFDSWAAFIGQVFISSVAWTSRHIIIILLLVGCELPYLWFGIGKAAT